MLSVFFAQFGKAFVICQFVSEFSQPAKPAAKLEKRVFVAQAFKRQREELQTMKRWWTLRFLCLLRFLECGVNQHEQATQFSRFARILVNATGTKQFFTFVRCPTPKIIIARV